MRGNSKRLAARSPVLQPLAFDYAGKAFGLIRDEREHAESKSDSYVRLARAVLTVSRSEAVAYFNQAVEVASKIGDENLDRWGALLDLADHAASRDRPNPVIAYRLGRCAELTYDYVARDKHFDWEATVEAISDDDETNHESGARFQASFAFIVSLLHELKMDLIVEIEIERRRYSRWERSNDDDIGFIPPSARLFLIRFDGSISTL
jgi:hypothetical protein